MNTSATAVPESDLIPVIRNEFLSQVLDKEGTFEGYTIGAEFRSQYGIPDLLFYNFDSAVLNKRMENKLQPVLSKEIIQTLLLIQNRKKISLSFLQDNLPFQKELIKNKVVKYLLQNNYLSRSIKGCESYWVGENTYESCMQDMYAVEAKVSNWKRGFYQAYRYKWFSNYSFLALHANHTMSALENMHLFKQYNIGLMSVDSNEGTVSVLNKPKRQKPFSKEIAALTFERLFASYCEKKATSQSAQSSFLII